MHHQYPVTQALTEIRHALLRDFPGAHNTRLSKHHLQDPVHVGHLEETCQVQDAAGRKVAPVPRHGLGVPNDPVDLDTPVRPERGPHPVLGGDVHRVPRTDEPSRPSVLRRFLGLARTPAPSLSENAHLRRHPAPYLARYVKDCVIYSRDEALYGDLRPLVPSYR
ncbi:daple-like protein [Babesia caballi]|uniref:Daple-like protein n=1 Tax=Babesia caballi TaxID=5871 RepID=A0AAV4LZ41_BABCB|nr:daple-like protein [Babesia caballi]